MKRDLETMMTRKANESLSGDTGCSSKRPCRRSSWCKSYSMNSDSGPQKQLCLDLLMLEYSHLLSGLHIFSVSRPLLVVQFV